MEAATPILIVEDELLIRVAAVVMFEGTGYETVDVADAEQAEQVLRDRHDIRLLFTDIDLPGRNGLVLASRTYAAWPEIDIVITSGKHQLMDEELPDHGSFLSKPYSQDQLLSLVAERLA